MSNPVKRLFAHGFSNLYGERGTGLHRQIIVWRGLGAEVRLIPSWNYYGEVSLRNEALSTDNRKPWERLAPRVY